MFPCSVGIFHPPECLSHETDLQFRQRVQASSFVSRVSSHFSLSLLHVPSEGIKTFQERLHVNV